MGQDYEHGYGTGAEDQLFETEGEARSALARLLTALGNLHLPAIRKERTVQYRGTNHRGQPLVVELRHDLDNPSSLHPEVKSSFDVIVKENGKGRNIHLAAKRR